ncbi:hypothetical protein KPH14_002840 [Odynerus spinipes]|uniref:Large ribosomal subunit protein mL66 n=1 Tax=Odynerus spinipes TaxID=1348599 RepID=A0AAD9VME1_9HYME|nr:hypothetical protein KPH14_002840 [Odynerus spinipes]
MAALCRFVAQIGKSFVFPEYNRAISLSATTRLKEIIEKKEGNDLIIEGVIFPDKDDHLLLKTKNGACPICSAGVDVKHTDVLILKQFVRSDGCMLPRRVTGLCKVQQKRISIMVSMAQKAGLMPNLAPPNSRKDPSRRLHWRKYNTYYDETTIKHRI